jgi:hypothetical protein
MIKELPNFRNYSIPWRGHPALHEEVARFATEDDRILGVVIRDRVDNDFGYVLIAHVDLVGRGDREPDYETSASGYRTITLEVSRPTQAIATEQRHAAMLRLQQDPRPRGTGPRP